MRSLYSETNTKCPPNISPPNISHCEYKPPRKGLRNSISPGLIFGILRYMIYLFIILIVKREITYQTESVKMMCYHCTIMILTFSISVILRVGLKYSCELFDSTWKSLWTFSTFSSKYYDFLKFLASCYSLIDHFLIKNQGGKKLCLTNYLRLPVQTI